MSQANRRQGTNQNHAPTTRQTEQQRQGPRTTSVAPNRSSGLSLAEQEQLKAEMLQKSLAIQQTPEQIRQKIKNNSMETIRKFMIKLKLPFPNQNPTIEDLMGELCTFLATDNGKRKAVSLISPQTFGDMYLQPNQLRSQRSVDARQTEDQANLLPPQPLSQNTIPPTIIPQQVSSLVPNKVNSDKPLQINQTQQQNLETQAKPASKAQASSASQVLQAPPPPPKPITPENDIVLANWKKKTSEYSKKKFPLNELPFDALELKRPDTKICYYDNYNQDVLRGKIFCICKDYSSPKKPQILCTECGFYSHKDCMSLNTQMKKFVCAQCQLLLIDPLQLPVQTVLSPFLVHQIPDEHQFVKDPSKPVFPPDSFKEFKLDSSLLKQLQLPYQEANLENQNINPKFLIQMRCLRMNNSDGIYSHNFPQFGFYRLNKGKPTHFKLNDPPNDKKRHDKFFDLTPHIKEGSNSVELLQITKQYKDTCKYACAIFIVRNYEVTDLTNYVKTLQHVIPFEEGLANIKKRFEKLSSAKGDKRGNELECEIYCQDIKIDLKCSFTQKQIKVPIKGQWCEHDQCFDLDTYVAMNQKPTSRKWICPCRPTDKPVILRRDEFTMRLLEISGSEDTCNINEDLEIKFKDGRVYKVFGNQFGLAGPLVSKQVTVEEKASNGTSSNALQSFEKHVEQLRITESDVPEQEESKVQNEPQAASKPLQTTGDAVQRLVPRKRGYNELGSEGNSGAGQLVNGFNDFQIDLDCSDSSDPKQIKKGIFNPQMMSKIPGEEQYKRPQQTQLQQQQPYPQNVGGIQPQFVNTAQYGMQPNPNQLQLNLPPNYQQFQNPQQYNQQMQPMPQSSGQFFPPENYYGMAPITVMPNAPHTLQQQMFPVVDPIKAQQLQAQIQEYNDMHQRQNQQEMHKQTFRMKDIVPTISSNNMNQMQAQQGLQPNGNLQQYIMNKNPLQFQTSYAMQPVQTQAAMTSPQLGHMDTQQLMTLKEKQKIVQVNVRETTTCSSSNNSNSTKNHTQPARQSQMQSNQSNRIANGQQPTAQVAKTPNKGVQQRPKSKQDERQALIGITTLSKQKGPSLQEVIEID